MYTFTNHFSKSELKSRIRMINRSSSSAVVWLRYPVLLLAIVTIASAFVQPQQVRQLSAFVPRPIAEALNSAEVAIEANSVIRDSAEALKPNPALSTVAQNQPVKPEFSTESVADSTIQETSRARVPASPSRYMQYEGDRLYWVITPKMSFDDLATMKQEFARHGYNMQIQTLKYDPLNTYISNIKVTIIRPVVGISDFDDAGADGGPIHSHGGYNGINALNTVAVVGSYPFKTSFISMPAELVQIARDEELSTTELVRKNRMKYLMAAGKEISRKYAPSSRILNVKGLLAQPNISQNYGIELNADSTLSIANTYLSIFINNEPVSNEAVKRVAIKKFDRLISSEELGRNGQSGAIRALLFYTTDEQ